MKTHSTITAKLTFVLVLFALALLASVSGLYYSSGHNALEAAVASDLLSTAIEKQAALDGWAEEMQSDVATLAANPTLIRHISAHRREAESAALQAEHQEMLAYLSQWTGEGKSLLSLLVLDPETGQVIVSTEPQDVGKFREDRPSFINGKNGPFIQNVYYSLVRQGPAMEAAAPIRSAQGQLVGVLVGQINLAGMNAIVQRRTGLRQTDDAYLVNTSHLFVTQPRFVSDPAVLQRGVHTEAVDRCLAHDSGSLNADDYRGVPALIVYRWLPKRELCLIVKVDQAEAVAPSRAFGVTVLLTSILVLLAASASAVWLARSITDPVRQLISGASEIGQGNLQHRIAVRSGDEIGQLSAAFNQMAANLHTSLGETARGHRLLFALSQAAQAVQRAHTPEAVYRAVGDEVIRLGYNSSIFTLTEDRAHLTLAHLTLQPVLQQAAEKLTGLSAQGYRFPLVPGGFYQRVLVEGKTTFVERSTEPFAEALPQPVRPLVGPLLSLLKIEQAIVARLVVGGETYGLLMVSGIGLSEADAPAVTVFANQIAIALENVRLYQEARSRAAELERRVEERTESLRKSEARLAHLNEVLRAMRDVNQFIARERDPQRLLSEACAILVQTRGYRMAWIGLSEEGHARVIPAARAGQGTDYLEQYMSIWVENASEQPAAGIALRTRQPVLCADVATDPRFVPWREAALGHGFASLAAMPMLHGERLFGTISVYADKPSAFDDEELSLLAELAGDLGFALQSIEDEARRKQAEEALRASEKRYRGLFEHMVEGYAYCQMIFENGQARDWIYLAVNDAFEALTGLKDVTGRRVTEVIPGIRETDPELFDRYARVSLTGKPEKFEIFVGAMQMWFSVSVYSPEKEFFVAVFDVITERKRAEEALRKWAQVFEHAEWGIAVSSPDGGQLEMMNPAFARMHGYTVEELIGRPVVDLIAPEERVRFMERVGIASDKGHYTFESTRLRKDGTSFPALVDVTVVKDEAGKVLYRIVNTQDITERKRAEAQLTEQLDELRRWHAVTLGRETRILELKREVNELLARLGEPIRYSSAEV